MKQTFTRLFSLGLGVALLQACGSKDQTTTAMQSGIILENMDTLTRPGDNFDFYVNGAWLKKYQIPSDRSSYGVSEILDDQAQENVRKIIEDAAKANAKSGTNEQKIGDLFSSFMDWETRNKIGIAPLKPVLSEIDALQNHRDLYAFFGKANTIGLDQVVGLAVMEDLKNPNINTLYLWQSGLTLPEREYYFPNDEVGRTILTKYQAFIEQLFAITAAGDPAKSAKAIIDLETRIAKIHFTKEETRDIQKMYNPYQRTDLTQLMPTFGWDAYLTASGIKDHKEFIVGQPQYFKDLGQLIENTPLDTWKAYLKWKHIQNSTTSLTKEMDLAQFEFFSKTLYGVKEQREMWRRGVSLVNGSLGEVVGKVYVDRHFSADSKKRMEVLVDNLLKAYEISIKELDWMSEDTKKQALEKLSKFTSKIGFPDKWKEYAKLEIKPGDLYGNLARKTAFEYQKELDKLGKPVDRSEWGMTPQTVNAYYNPLMNEIVFPAAILQSPFFDLNTDDAVNYGSIGAVIGHEIGHGFDDQGASFDGDGVLRNWWTAADLEAFKKRTSLLVEQFNQYEVLPGLHINGEFTLGENIGDLGGIAIAFKAYKLSLNGKEAPVMDGFTGEQRFFIGYAQSWLYKAREESLRNQIATDPHAPAHYRVNGIVRNIPEFYEAFKVQPSDSLYLAPEKRVKIW